MKLVCCKNIFCDEVSLYISKLINNTSYIYLTNSPITQSEREKSPILYSHFNNNDNAYYFENFFKMTARKVYDNKNYLSNSDISYILEKILNLYFKDHDSTLAYQHIDYELFDFYKTLLLNGLQSIPKCSLDKIKAEYSVVEYDIFKIYNHLLTVLDEIVSDFRNGNKLYTNKDLGITLKAPVNTNKDFDIFINSHKLQIDKELKNTEHLILDGFFYLPEKVNFLIDSAVKNQKEIILITKDIKTDLNTNFLIDALIEKTNLNYNDIEFINFEYKENTKTNLDYIKNNFRNSYSKTINNIHEKDGSVEIFTPFLTRKKEMDFITSYIGETLKKAKLNSFDEIKSAIENDYVIVTAVNYYLLAEQLNNAFKKRGIFFHNGCEKNLLRKAVNINTFEKVFYSLNDFLQTSVCYVDGSKLSLSEKKLYFESAFSRISVDTLKPNLASHPVLEYIFQLYDILRYGISYNKLKKLLFSNWKYHIKESPIKWDKYIGLLDKIRSFLKDNTDIDVWISEIEKILLVIDNSHRNPLYKNHPFNTISKSDLQELLNILKELNVIITSLKNVNGNVQFHLDFLKNQILNFQNINDSDKNLTDEQQTIINFYHIIENILSDSALENLDSAYFAKHLRSLFMNFEMEEVTSNPRNFRLRMSNMIGLKRYKNTFFIACENNKYPRPNNDKFPFTTSMKEILMSGNYGFKLNNLPIKNTSFHLELEKYLFNNVLDFTTEKICFTASHYTDKHKTGFSTYVNNVSKILNIGFETPKILRNDSSHTNNVRKLINESAYFLTKNKFYTIKELITFKLCPKLYYHLYLKNSNLCFKGQKQLRIYAEKVFYIDLLKRFMNYNLENKKWYKADQSEAFDILNEFSKQILYENMNYFGFFSPKELESLREITLENVLNYINTSIIEYLGYNIYTIVPAKEKNYQFDGFILKTENDTAVYTNKKGSKRASQISLGLDFLVFKSTNREIKTKKYNEMMLELNKNKKYIDRIFFANRMINKITIQFDSVKFENDGRVRVSNLVNELLNTDFFKVKPYPSNYCNYCIIKDVCMGYHENQKRDDI